MMASSEVKEPSRREMYWSKSFAAIMARVSFATRASCVPTRACAGGGEGRGRHLIDYASLQMTLPSPYETLVWTIFVRASMVASAPPLSDTNELLGRQPGGC